MSEIFLILSKISSWSKIVKKIINLKKLICDIEFYFILPSFSSIVLLTASIYVELSLYCATLFMDITIDEILFHENVYSRLIPPTAARAMYVNLIVQFLFILNEISWVTLIKFKDNVHTWTAGVVNAAIVQFQASVWYRWWSYVCRVSLKQRLNVL